MVIELDDREVEGLQEEVFGTHPAIFRVIAIPGGGSG
jgi:hypothetical protein